MQGIIKGIFDVIIWAFVPAAMAMVIFRCHGIAKKIEHKHYKNTAHSGFWAGFVLFVIVVVYQVGLFLKTGFPDLPIYHGFNLFWASVAAGAVFSLFYGGRRVISPKLAGWIVLASTFASFWIFFHYLFIHTYNEYILSAVLGAAFGLFAHTAFSPISLEDLIKFS